jgi:type II secretory pathway component PulK
MSRRAEGGMTLIVALFLVMVISLLAAFAVSMGTAVRSSTNLTLLSGRALAAARTGAEWGAFRAINQGVCQNPYPVLNLAQGALRGFRVEVRCTARTAHNDGVAFVVADITATAQWSNYGHPDYVYRQVTVRYQP